MVQALELQRLPDLDPKPATEVQTAVRNQTLSEENIPNSGRLHT